MSPKRVYTQAYASVRFYSDALDPLDVTLRLRLPPDHTHRAGEPRLRRRRDGSVAEYAPYRAGMWLMSSEHWVSSPRVEVHVDWLVSQLEPKADELRALLASGVEADIFCFSQGSTATPPGLPRQLQARAEALELTIKIDHYEV